jgi:murein DD-endopeptidase MepM/ murein hydrolase activator NlpD
MISKLKMGIAILITMIMALPFTLLPSRLSAQAGANLSLPFARRSLITQNYSSDHRAIDYRATTGTPVVGARAGTVTVAHNDHPDDWHSTVPDYGNWIEIDHGGGYKTRYAHLSHSGFAVSVGTPVYRGQRIANADNTGYSFGSHLHFELYNYGTPVNPYPDGWVSGSPIPMGYRDQNGTVHGPFPLDRAKIHDKWLALQGKPGAPLEDDHTGTCVQSGTGLLATLYIQGFEQGYIQYCGSGAAEYVAYPKTYLPDTKIAYNGWNSSVTAHNNGGATEVSITFYQADGKVADSRAYDPHLATNANWTLETSSLASDETNPINNVAGSAVVAAEADTSVVVENQYGTSRSYAYNGITAGGSGDPTFEKVGTTLYAPSFYNNAWDWTSTLEVINTGSATANVQIQFKGRSGYGDTTRTYSIPPNGRLELAASSVWGGTPWVGSLVIQSTNGQPLAAVVFEFHISQATRAYNASSVGTSLTYVPAAYKNKWGMTSGVVVQNVGSGSITAYLYFYDRAGNYVTSVSLPNIGAGRAQGLWLGDEGALPDGWTGWVKVLSSNPLAVYVNTARPEDHYAYTGASTTGNTAILPWAAKNASGHTTGYTVLNTSSSSVQVTATYYNTSGSIQGSEVYSLPARGVEGRYQGGDTFLPDGWQGSIVLQANGLLVAVMREDSSSTTSAYNGVAR